MFIKKIRNSEGFSLVELLEVMVILIILSLGVFYFVDRSSDQARDTIRIDALDKFTELLDVYHLQYGKYPCGDSNNVPSTGIFQNGTADSSSSSGFLNAAKNSPPSNCVGDPKTGLHDEQLLVDPWPKDPINIDDEYEYWYFVTRDRQSYILFTRLEINDERMVNDGGTCDNLYEVGPAVGQSNLPPCQ